MGVYFDLVCHETRQRMHLGRGHEGTMESVNLDKELADFLRATQGKPLVVLSEHVVDASPVSEYEEFPPPHAPAIGG